jgi:hypothetical protein
VASYRKQVVAGASDILYGLGRDKSIVERLPVLHASDLPRYLDDDQKVSLFSHVIQTAIDHDARFFRVGYFVDQSIPMLSTRERHIEFCLTNCLYPIQSHFDEDIAYVYELSYAAHRQFTSYNDAHLHDAIWQSGTLYRSISIPRFEKIVGKFYCDKHNHSMYASDFLGYSLMLRDKNPISDFSERLMSCADLAQGHIVYDEVIQMAFVAT